MERILALQALTAEGMYQDPVLGSTESVNCSSDTNNGCSTTSNHCRPGGFEQW